MQIYTTGPASWLQSVLYFMILFKIKMHFINQTVKFCQKRLKDNLDKNSIDALTMQTYVDC